MSESLPDRSAADRDAPASPIATPQAKVKGAGEDS